MAPRDIIDSSCVVIAQMSKTREDFPISPPEGVEAILRLPQVMALTGRKKSSLYKDVKSGVFTKPISIGPRNVGWPASEVAAVNRARIAGKSTKEICDLVVSLHEARATA